jgi:hypothetical protein
MDLNQVTLPALDVGESAEFFKRMGFLQIVDSPHYARFECPDGDATFSLHAVETKARGSVLAMARSDPHRPGGQSDLSLPGRRES